MFIKKIKVGDIFSFNPLFYLNLLQPGSNILQAPQHYLLLKPEFKNSLFFAKISLTKGTT